MDLRFSRDDEAFRLTVREWLEAQLSGEYRALRGVGGPGRDHELLDQRFAWERALGAAGWIGLGWPKAAGGRGATLFQQVIFHEEYARARAPGRAGHIGEYLLGPTIAALGTEDQKRRFLPPIARGEEMWCQGYSEPNAGSDLAGVQTRAELVGGQWRVTGQKIWTSHAQIADHCFVLCRTDLPDQTNTVQHKAPDQRNTVRHKAPDQRNTVRHKAPDQRNTVRHKAGAKRHAGLTYLLLPMRQEGVTVRPIRQMTGTAEFCEVFFDGARAPEENVVGAVGDGWRVAMSTLAFERGASTLGQQTAFANELAAIIAAAVESGAAMDPLIRQRIADAWIGLRVMRWNALRILSHGERGELPREALISKIYWATWHRQLGELAMDVLGADAELAPEGLSPLQEMALFSRADTIYAGSNEIQKNIIATRALGLPKGGA